ncbi:tyrosine-type recombinase/integrase [Geomonas azotofigens]|uniref:tyrosine-type recombinase/integrase n=1 Tax=Geomonas azotofigens TaxID=2843196 RepID=UPI001C10DA9A|nr:site-specific integrase [Geomonas azotofigens]MBU5613744.1 tyrosine-type recombinase/integrase [Geomonas azotofigens]
MKFTDMMIRNLKPKEKKFYLREGNGFAICVYPSGVKSWMFIYSIDGMRRYISLGNYPGVSLGDAKSKYHKMWEVWKNGKDPGAKPIREVVPTVKTLVEEYLTKHAKPKKRSWKTDERLLRKELLPLWGKLKVNDVRKRDVILLLEGVVERGAPATSNVLLMVSRKMFNFAVERDILDARDNPFLGVRPLSAIVRRDRTLSVTEIKTFWDKLESLPIEDKTRRVLKLILVTGQRPGEISGMHAREIDGDWWTIPSERSKNKKAHRVFLTPLAKSLIGNSTGYIFPGRNDAEKPIGRITATNAVKTHCEEGTFGIPPFTPHDLRRTVATHMPRIGVLREHREAVLNHTMPTVEGTYDLYSYDKEKQRALERWSRELERIVTGESGKVISIGTSLMP